LVTGTVAPEPPLRGNGCEAASEGSGIGLAD